MSEKKIKVLHVIDSLVRGGAELVFVKYINTLPSFYENVIVYLHGPEDLLPDICNAKIYKLNFIKKHKIVSAVIKLNQIIKSHEIEIIHSHLFWSTLISRLAKPKRVHLIYSVHNKISFDAFKLNKKSLWAEMMTATSRQTALFVSEAAKSDYREFIKVPNKYFVLHNFVDEAFFGQTYNVYFDNKRDLRLIAVGTLKKQKNFPFLLACMKALINDNISLDIYGEGPEKEKLAQYIEKHNLNNVHLMGAQTGLEKVLVKYDMFVIASEYEGFCVAMAEAMAVGLPCLVSDIDVLREVSDEKQMYFSLLDTADFVEKIKSIIETPNRLSHLSRQAKLTASKFRLDSYILRLTSIYQQLLSQ